MQHIKDRVIAAVRAMQDIKNLTLLSLTQQWNSSMPSNTYTNKQPRTNKGTPEAEEPSHIRKCQSCLPQESYWHIQIHTVKTSLWNNKLVLPNTQLKITITAAFHQCLRATPESKGKEEEQNLEQL
jgi:hypothetical protein